jgi:hypothetical protein
VQKKKVKRISVSAMPGKDEKEFNDSATRCLTKEIKALHAATVARMNKDIAAKGTGHDAVVATYKEKIATVWSAMEQPYCGFGSRGLAAVRHSYEKSVERIRAEFLVAVK